MTGKPVVCLTVDVEPDCPPFLDSHRGMIEGLPRLLDLLAAEKVAATFFISGREADAHPDRIADILAAGHEPGCHGWGHLDYAAATPDDVRADLARGLASVRALAPVDKFRAPYLRLPEMYLDTLAEMGVRVDSSAARYKYPYTRAREHPDVRRIPVSATSSVLRLPGLVRNPWLRALNPPVVIFVHPWEFVDLRREKMRYDCRFRTGPRALACLARVIRDFRAWGFEFRTLGDL